MNTPTEDTLAFVTMLERNQHAKAVATALKTDNELAHFSTYAVLPGQTYDKVTEVTRMVNVASDGSTSDIPNWNNRGMSVHAFVKRATGDLIKAASWKAPQKSLTHPSGLAVRFNLSTPAGMAEALTAANATTGYLYAN